MVAALATLAFGGLLLWQLFSTQGDKRLFLSSQTSDGHHQIEAQCGLCHRPFDGIEEDACRECHAAELKAARDSHPAGAS